MLQTFYYNFGFAGSLIITFLLFLFIIFWIAGLAGICMRDSVKSDNDRDRTKEIIAAVLIPPYPFFWMVWEIYSQKKQLREAD